MPGLGDEVAAIVQVEELQAALRRTQAKLARKEQRAEELAAAVYRAAFDAALSFGKPRPVAKPASKGKGGEEVALVHLTDWQFGKATASYDMDVCRARIGMAVDKVREITDLRRASAVVDRCVVMLGGDMVEGVSIFPGQAYEVQAHLYEQLFGVSRLIVDTLRALLGSFVDVDVVCEYGNHGRLGRRGDMPSADNVDRMAYEIARQQLADELRLSWQSSPDFYQSVTIGNYRALLIHGDEINSYGGNHPSYGIVKRVSGWQAGGGGIPEFTDCYIGHFHRPDTYTLPAGGSIFITGSPESGNAYAAAFMAASGRPTQRLHFIDPVKGRVIAEHRLELD